MKRLIIAFAIFFLVLGFSACEKYVIPPSEDVYVTYSASIQPIWLSDCVSCHEDRDPILTQSESYNDLKNGGYVNTDDPESSSLYTKLYGSHATRTSENNKLIILDWIKAGAPND